MKKILPLLALVSLLTACVPTEQEQIDHALDEVTQEVYEENEDFYNENQGGSPEEVLDARIESLSEQYSEDYGTVDEFTGIGYTGDMTYTHAAIAAEKLGLPYSRLAYVQYLSGTSGMSTLIRAMDSSAPGVAELQAMFQEYDAITADDAEYFESIMPAGLSDDEKVAFIVKTYADLYRVFDEPYDSYGQSTYQEADMNQIQRDTGLDADDLATIFAYGFPELIGETFPDSWGYKAQFIELAKY